MKVIANLDENGKIVYSSEIVSAIIECALEGIEGVAKSQEPNKKINKKYRSGIKIETVNDEIFIDVFVKLFYNVSVRDVSYWIQQGIKDTIESMTAFKIKNINVHVIDVELNPPIN